VVWRWVADRASLSVRVARARSNDGSQILRLLASPRVVVVVVVVSSKANEEWVKNDARSNEPLYLTSLTSHSRRVRLTVIASSVLVRLTSATTSGGKVACSVTLSAFHCTWQSTVQRRNLFLSRRFEENPRLVHIFF
jgi:hypothetical protein